MCWMTWRAMCARPERRGHSKTKKELGKKLQAMQAREVGPGRKLVQNIRRVAMPLKKRELADVTKDICSNFCQALPNSRARQIMASSHQADGI